MITAEVSGMWSNDGVGYGLEIPVLHPLYEQEKLINWTVKKLEGVETKVDCSVKVFEWNIWTIIIPSWLFLLSANWKEKSKIDNFVQKYCPLNRVSASEVSAFEKVFISFDRDTIGGKWFVQLERIS